MAKNRSSEIQGNIAINTITNYQNLEIADIFKWIEDLSIFNMRFQNEDDFRRSMLSKGNKYGDYTELVIQETIKLRKEKN